MLTRSFEDFSPGKIFEAGTVSISEEAIVAFARQYDPQVFHTDPVAATSTIYGGLIASGWHTIALCMRLIVDNVFGHTGGMGSPGVDELRWTLPVRPDDTLSVSVTVLETRASRSKPDRGVMRFRVDAKNQDGEPVLHATGTCFVARRR
jgi:acyl dehydratase